MTNRKKSLKIGDITVTPLVGGKIKLSLGDKSTTVAYKDLWGPTFLLGKDDKELQDQLVPEQKKEMMVFSRKHQIMLQKDMKKGETVNVWCEVNIPQTIVAAIAEENGAKVILQAPEPVAP